MVCWYCSPAAGDAAFSEHVADALTPPVQATSRVTGWWERTVNGGERQRSAAGLQSFAEGWILARKALTQVHIHKIAFPPIDSLVVITEGEWLKSLNRYPFEVQSLLSASFNLIQQVDCP